jgi:hypothetical protein
MDDFIRKEPVHECALVGEHVRVFPGLLSVSFARGRSLIVSTSSTGAAADQSLRM